MVQETYSTHRKLSERRFAFPQHVSAEDHVAQVRIMVGNAFGSLRNSPILEGTVEDLEAILRGDDGEVRVSRDAIYALYAANMLYPYGETMFQLSDLGWRDISQRERDPHEGRVFQYYVTTPERCGVLTIPNELVLYARCLAGVFDFTYWTLSRQEYRFRKDI